MITREQATEDEDLPHKFIGLGRHDRCQVCDGERDDERHLAWEKSDLRETAASTVIREIGS